MATENSTSTPERADHPVRLTGTPNWHYAAMRRYENAARGISVRRSVGSIPVAELDAAKAVQTSYYLMAAAHRNAAHRLERGERIRIRVEAIVRPVTRIVRSVRRAVTA
jgi:hypothetical protein